MFSSSTQTERTYGTQKNIVAVKYSTQFRYSFSFVKINENISLAFYICLFATYDLVFALNRFPARDRDSNNSYANYLFPLWLHHVKEQFSKLEFIR